MPDEIPQNTTEREVRTQLPSTALKPLSQPSYPRPIRQPQPVQDKPIFPVSPGILWPIIGAVIILIGLLGWAGFSSYSSTHSQTQTTSSTETTQSATPAPALQQNIQMGNYTGSIEDTADPGGGDLLNKKVSMSFNIANQGTGSILQGDLTIQNGLTGSGKFFASIAGNRVKILDASTPWIEFDGTVNSDGSLNGKYTTSEQQCGTWNLTQGSDGNYSGKVVNTCVGGDGDFILTVKNRKDNVSLVTGTMNISDHLYFHYADGAFLLDCIGYTDTNNITLYAIVKEAKGVNIGEEAYTFNGQMSGTLSGTYSDTYDSGDWSVNHN